MAIVPTAARAASRSVGEHARRAVVVVGLALGGLTGSAAAKSDNGEGKKCWGVVSAGLAGVGEMGTHASEQEEPRRGLGNLSTDFGFTHISDFGAFLAEIDGIDETSCS